MSESQPSSASPSPSQEDNLEERIRAAFALPSDAPLPKVKEGTLLRYHEYLAQKISFPFQALYDDTSPPIRQLVRHVTVVGLSDNPRRRQYGLFCKVQIGDAVTEVPLADLGIPEDNPNFQLIEDYLRWLWSSS